MDVLTTQWKPDKRPQEHAGIQGLTEWRTIDSHCSIQNHSSLRGNMRHADVYNKIITQ